MNFGILFVILIAIVGSTFGMILIGAHMNDNAPPDSYGREPTQVTNLTKENVTAVMPVGINLMGYAAYIVGFIIVVVAILGLIALMGKGNYGSHR